MAALLQEDRRLPAHLVRALPQTRTQSLADENEELKLLIRTTHQELAASKHQLNEMLDDKQQELSRGARSLTVLHEALHHIPLPILGIDDGIIAFANQRAQETLGQKRPLLLSRADVVLPALGAALAVVREGDMIDINIDHQTYRTQWHRLGVTPPSESRLVVLNPQARPSGSDTLTATRV